MLGTGVQIVAAHLQANSHITKNKQLNKTEVEAIGYSRARDQLPQVFDFKCYVDDKRY